jgi:hypothetical protein
VDAAETIDAGDGAAEGWCLALVDALCERDDACAHFAIEEGYGDVATCKSRTALLCPDLIALAGVSIGKACVDAYLSRSCWELFHSGTPHECVGTFVDGAACGSGSQCASGYCKMAAAAACGVCAEYPGICTFSCAAGLVCASGSCVAPGAAGDACTLATMPCADHLSCVGGKCVAAAKPGERCAPDGSAPVCDYDSLCSGAGVCLTLSYAGLGETCGATGSTTFVFCHDAACRPTGGGLGVCTAYFADGAACPVDECALPYSCVAGVCTLSDPAACK